MKRFLIRLADRYGLKLKEQELQAILRFARSSSEYPEREKRLEELARQIRSGKYRIDYERVADGILGDGLETHPVHLAESLKRMPLGLQDWRPYEEACSLLIFLTFGSELSHFETQCRVGGRSRVDLCAYNQASAGFWSDMKTCHQVSHVIFEIKNKNRLDRNDLDQILRYARPFRALVAVTREPHPQSVYVEMAGLLRENKVVLPISTQDLEIAAALVAQGQRGSEALIPRYQQLVAAQP